MSLAELGRFAEGFAVWRRALAGAAEDDRIPVFTNAATEVASYLSKGLDRALAADELVELASAYGLDNVDAVQWIISRAFEKAEQNHVPDVLEEPRTNGRHRSKKKSAVRLFGKQNFMGGFVPPDYLIETILQRRFVYALTGQTGHAKTAIALLIAELVSSNDQNAMLGRHRVEKGRVIYFVGENPDDIRMRLIGSDSQRNDDEKPLEDRITFAPGQFNILEAHDEIAAHAGELGGVDLVIVDTSAAYFLGQDENANPQIGAHARMLRRLTELPGGPCVLVLCHPIKYVTEANQLLPRGGGSFLAEMDGNLTAHRHNDNLIELHHNKIRGPGFEPITFKLETIRTTNLTDAKGRLIPTVRAVAITQAEEDQQTNKTRTDEDHVLAVRLKSDSPLSITEIARRAGWEFQDGSPAKSRVQRALERLEKAKPALAYRDRGQWHLTEKGKEAARKAALNLAAQEAAAAERNQPRFEL